MTRTHLPKRLFLARSFLAHNSLQLKEYAVLLGGLPALGRFARLRQELETARTFSRRHRAELGALQSLLKLENVHDFETLEAGLFAEVSPDDPKIHVICALTDQLDAVLGEIDRTQASAVAPISYDAA